MKDERSYVLKTDLHFNYWCNLQVIQEDKKYLKYKVYYVIFDQEKFSDTICMSRMHLVHFDPMTTTRSEIRIIDGF